MCWGVCLNICSSVSVTDLHHIDADPGPSFHFDADPDPTFHSVADPDPNFYFIVDPDPLTTVPRVPILVFF